MGRDHPGADFETAMNAFALFSLDDRRQTLEHFAKLAYPSIDDRFFEAVYRVIETKQSGKLPHDPKRPRRQA